MEGLYDLKVLLLLQGVIVVSSGCDIQGVGECYSKAGVTLATSQSEGEHGPEEFENVCKSIGQIDKLSECVHAKVDTCEYYIKVLYTLPLSGMKNASQHFCSPDCKNLYSCMKVILNSKPSKKQEWDCSKIQDAIQCGKQTYHKKCEGFAKQFLHPQQLSVTEQCNIAICEYHYAMQHDYK
ncbi:unnamed protein product [Owenia fusiformis]|uniref:Uncharacterized protein n=1 Tax=Owenia fusiformis TaxID=6347 RepID=A0A8S4P392_OWEFU|nr:unnamed protein product [Owenia fusiformis]